MDPIDATFGEFGTTYETKELQDEKMEEQQLSLIEGIDYFYEVNKDEQCSPHFKMEYKEEEAELSIYKGRNYYMLGIEKDNTRELLSCTKKKKDINYTICNIENERKELRFSYSKHPKLVYNHTVRILKTFADFFAQY
jgi:hypothetical protein